MGSAVGQVPEYVEMVTRWCKQHTRMPVIVKLTPNVTDILAPAAAAQRGGADGVSLINTRAIDHRRRSRPDGAGAGGGRPRHAWRLLRAGDQADRIAHGRRYRARPCRGCRCPGIGGIAIWRDAAEFIALGAGNVQVCTAAMHHGFKIVEDMIDGLSNWMDGKGYRYDRAGAWTGGAQLCALERPEPELPDRRADRSGSSASSAACAISAARTPRIRRSRRCA